MAEKLISSRRSVLLIAVIAMMAAGVFIAHRVGSDSVMPSASADRSEPDDKHQQLVRVWVHGDAIQPPVIYAQPGRILFKADNETQSDISLVIERVTPGQANARVATMGTQRKAKRVGQEMTLSPGEYAVYEESQPQYRATLIVQAKEERDR
jgi:hypothetical protein